jgi:hypothetical protein
VDRMSTYRAYMPCRGGVVKRQVWSIPVETGRGPG